MKFCSGKEFPSGAIKSQQSRKEINKLRENVELQIEVIENKIRCLDIQKKVLSEHSRKKKGREIGNVDIPFGANPYTSLIFGSN